MSELELKAGDSGKAIINPAPAHKPDFGRQNSWLLINREGGRETIILPVQGKGVLMQVREEVFAGMGKMVQQTQPILIPGVVVVQYMSTDASQITDGEGVPLKSSMQVQHRELVSVEMIRKHKGIQNAKDTRAGAVVTFQVGPNNQGQQPAEA